MNITITQGVILYEPEISYIKDKVMAITKFYLAVDDNQQRDVFSVMAFGHTAEKIFKEYKIGDEIAFIGSIRNNNFRDANKTRHYQCYLLASEIVEINAAKGQINTVIKGKKTYLPLTIEDFIYTKLGSDE